MTTVSILVDRRVILEGVSWSLYQNLLAEVGDGHTRLTFDHGRLEIMSPSHRHELVKKVLARIVESYADAMNIAIEGAGSTTFSREDLQKGLEPDECYYIASARMIIGKEELDLQIDPPPDLAIEIDISAADVAREPIYAAMGVPEIWRYDGAGLTALVRNQTGGYSLSKKSLGFPKLSLELVNELIVIGISRGQAAAITELRRRIN